MSSYCVPGRYIIVIERNTIKFNSVFLSGNVMYLLKIQELLQLEVRIHFLVYKINN